MTKQESQQMNDLTIYPPGTKLNNLQRRTVARAEMYHFPEQNIFRYLCTTQHARHYRAKDGVMWHNVIDQINIVYEPLHKDAKKDFDPRFIWRNMKNRLEKGDVQLWQKLAHMKLPSWDDHRWYATDIISTGWLFFLVTSMHTPIANAVRGNFAERINEKEREEYAGKVQLIDEELYGVGSGVQLLMQSIYTVGDYDEPKGRGGK